METTNFQVKSCIHVYGRWLQVSRKRETFTQRGRAVVPTPMPLSSSTRHPKVFEEDESLSVDEQEEGCDHIELRLLRDFCLGELLDTSKLEGKSLLKASQGVVYDTSNETSYPESIAPTIPPFDPRFPSAPK